jgi:hypothetical protein
MKYGYCENPSTPIKQANIGTHRDYKTRASRININLSVHKILMENYERRGYDRNEASKQALTEMRTMTQKDKHELLKENKEENPYKYLVVDTESKHYEKRIPVSSEDAGEKLAAKLNAKSGKDRFQVIGVGTSEGHEYFENPKAKTFIFYVYGRPDKHFNFSYEATEHINANTTFAAKTKLLKMPEYEHTSVMTKKEQDGWGIYLTLLKVK